MAITYAQKQAPAQKNDAPTASSIIDASSQREFLQRKADMVNNAAQRAEIPRPNNTGMPDNLKAGIESLSGFSMDDVRVHYNSSKPATVQALAYTQGTDIHVAPGQEKHLPHEAWHVAQQMAGRVSPTTNINGMPVNDNAALEHEADFMGEKAVTQRKDDCRLNEGTISKGVCQRETAIEYQPMVIKYTDRLAKMDEENMTGGLAKMEEENITGEFAKTDEEYMTDEAPTKEEEKHASAKSLETDGLNYSSVKVGHLTRAKLNPFDPVQGSEPGTHQTDLMESIKPYNYKINPFIKGHLLNHHLGGLGIADNMIPITEHANALHEMYVEQGVKNLVYANRIKAIHKDYCKEKTKEEAIAELNEAIKNTNEAQNILDNAKKKSKDKNRIDELNDTLDKCKKNEAIAREKASAKTISSDITDNKEIEYTVQADMLNSNQIISKTNPPEVLLSCSVTYDKANPWEATIHSGPRPEEASSSGNITNMINSFLEGDGSDAEKSNSDTSKLNLNYLHISAPELENVGLGGALTENGKYATGMGKKGNKWYDKTVSKTISHTPLNTYLPNNNDVELFKAMRAIDTIKEGVKAKIHEAALNGTLGDTIQAIQRNVNICITMLTSTPIKRQAETDLEEEMRPQKKQNLGKQ